ncbi:MAG: hypothetical protein IKC43_02280 [Clostridia bacterium]|nr:hypothetical protein [Clostridia bacterium]
MKDKKSKEDKESRFSRFLRYTDVSLCAFTDFKIEIEKSGCRGEKSLTAYGTSGIRTLKKQVVALDYDSEYLVIRGRRLDCHAYADGAMNVRGVITCLQFCDKEAYSDEDT